MKINELYGTLDKKKSAPKFNIFYDFKPHDSEKPILFALGMYSLDFDKKDTKYGFDLKLWIIFPHNIWKLSFVILNQQSNFYYFFLPTCCYVHWDYNLIDSTKNVVKFFLYFLL